MAGNPVLCRFGRVLATTNGLMDGTTRLHPGDERIHHLMGVSCFAERVVVSETSVVPVPDGVPPEIAAISACAVVTGVGAVLNAVHRRPVVHSPSSAPAASASRPCIGAALTGAHPVIAIDVDPVSWSSPAGSAPPMSIDARETDVVERVLEISGGGVPWMIEAVGRPETMRQAMGCLAARRHARGDRPEQRRRHLRDADQRPRPATEADCRFAVRLQQPAASTCPGSSRCTWPAGYRSTN